MREFKTLYDSTLVVAEVIGKEPPVLYHFLLKIANPLNLKVWEIFLPHILDSHWGIFFFRLGFGVCRTCDIQFGN